MNFREQYNKYKTIFNLENEITDIPGTDLKIRNYTFRSPAYDIPRFSNSLRDINITENCTFRYPVITPGDGKKYGRAIIYLHGLNERTWYKHLAGAGYLAEMTCCPVILFPLSFHINRGPAEWADVRKMADHLPERRNIKNIREVSVANVAISERLTEYPERFFTSGLNSGMDLLHLLRMIKSGEHTLFEQESQCDIFAYSVSCTLIQTLLIINPDNMLTGSKIVLFAGGSIFGRVNGVSRYIIDSVAFDKIIEFYNSLINGGSLKPSGFRGWFLENVYGKAFRAVFSGKEYETSRIRAMDTFHKNIMVIALKDDKVIPLDGIREAMGNRFSNSDNFRILHFSYPYTHENPFPVNNIKNDNQLNEAFNSVYEPAFRFYTN